MNKILFFHHTLFNKITGSAEKLLRDFIEILSDSGKFEIYVAYSKDSNNYIPENFLNKNIKFIEFNIDHAEISSPYRYVNMAPSMAEILGDIQPNAFIGLVWGDNQSNLFNLPNWLPVIELSPFGHFTSNGNLRKLLVSGASNVSRLKRKGVYIAEVLFNPLRIPEFNEEKAFGRPKDRPIILGRTGRADPSIFDPISLLAFEKLEKKYGEQVKYIYVNPPYQAKQLVEERGIKGVDFLDWLSEDQLDRLYRDIDIFAHARLDGETLGMAIAESMLYQNVVVTHVSKKFNDHLFLVRKPFALAAEVNNVEQYYEALDFYVTNRENLPSYGVQAREFARQNFDISLIREKIINDCLDVCSYSGNPLPLKLRFYFYLHKTLFGFKIKMIQLIKKLGY